MGCTPSSDTKFDAEVESGCVALIFHTAGVYGVKPDGTYVQVNSENWVNAKVALKTGDNEAVCFHQKCIYNLVLQGEAAGYKTLNDSDGWSLAKAAIQSPAHPESVVVIHDWGVYSVSLEDGSNVQLRDDRWGLTTAAVYDPDTSSAVLFHAWGLYRINLGDGAFTELSQDKWAQTKAATYVSDGTALVFHDQGIYRVKLADGSWTKVNEEGWSQTKAAVSSTGDNVLCFHDYAIYSVNAKDGTYTKVNDETWVNTKAVCPMGPNAFASSAVVAAPSQAGVNAAILV